MLLLGSYVTAWTSPSWITIADDVLVLVERRCKTPNDVQLCHCSKSTGSESWISTSAIWTAHGWGTLGGQVDHLLHIWSWNILHIVVKVMTTLLGGHTGWTTPDDCTMHAKIDCHSNHRGYLSLKDMKDWSLN